MVDLKRRETITDRWIASRSGWTPYNGVAVTGWPVGTFVRGRKVMWQGEVVTPSTGEAVRLRRDAVARKLDISQTGCVDLRRDNRRLVALVADQNIQW